MGRTVRKKIARTSTARRITIINEVTDIKTVFTAIPKRIENKTSPSLYSFFKGLKKVLRRL